MKTPSQLKKSYKTKSRICIGSEFISAMTPFFIIGIANYEEYFVEYNRTKMSISFFMAMAVMGIAIWAITKKKLENSYATLLIGWIVMAFIFTMMGEMITDLATIMWFGLIGLAGATGLDELSKFYKNKAQKIEEAEKQADKDKLVSEVKAERKIKVKVKK